MSETLSEAKAFHVWPWLAMAFGSGLLKALLNLAATMVSDSAGIAAIVLAGPLVGLAGFCVLGFYIYRASQFRTRSPANAAIFTMATLIFWGLVMLAMLNLDLLASLAFYLVTVLHYGTTA